LLGDQQNLADLLLPYHLLLPRAASREFASGIKGVSEAELERLASAGELMLSVSWDRPGLGLGTKEVLSTPVPMSVSWQPQRRCFSLV
jgi:hypothetical protein